MSSCVERALDLGEPLAAVDQVVLEHPERVVQHRAVRRPEGLHRTGGGEVAHPLDRLEVRAEVAVRPGDDGRPAAEHHVARQQRLLRREQQRERVVGVAGREHRLEPEAVDLDDLAVGDRIGVEGVRRAPRPHRAALAAAQLLGGLGVVEVVVGHQHQPDVAGLLVEQVQVALLDGARVDHDRLGRRRARAAPRCWCRRGSSGPGWGRAGTGRARRRSLRPRARSLRWSRAAHGRCRSATSGRSRSGIDSVQPSPSGSTAGVNMSTSRSDAASTSSGDGKVPDLEAGEVRRRQHQHLARVGPVATASAAGSQVTSEDSDDTSRVRWPSGSRATKNQVR